MPRAKSSTPTADEVEDFGADDDVQAVPGPTAAELNDPSGERKIGGIDFSELDDDNFEDDFDADSLGSSSNLDPNRYVVVKFVNAPQYHKRDYDIQVNGQKAVFPRGKWVISRFYFVDAARHQGVMDFTSAGQGARNMKAIANRPIFEVKEIKDAKAQKDVSGIKAFQTKAEKARGTSLPFAHTSLT